MRNRMVRRLGINKWGKIRDEDIWSPLQILDHSDREKIEPILEVGGIMPVI